MNLRTLLVVTTVVVATVVVATASVASAEELAPLEQPGTVMTGFSLFGQQIRMENKSGPSSLDTASIGGAVSAEVFVTPLLTVGGAISASWSRATQDEVSNGYIASYSPTARVGVYLPLSDHVGIWPYAFGGFSRTSGRYVDTVDAWSIGAGARFVLRFDDRWSLVAQPIQFTHTVASSENTFGASGIGLLGSSVGVDVAL